MRKTVLIPLVFEFILLLVGVIQSCSSLKETFSRTISCTGTIRYNGEPQPQQTISTTQLDIMGFLTILVSVGFFTLAYLNKRSIIGK